MAVRENTKLLAKEIKGLLRFHEMKDVPVRVYSDWRIEISVYGNKEKNCKIHSILADYFDDSYVEDDISVYINKVNVSIL